jgi:hypothetical protein
VPSFVYIKNKLTRVSTHPYSLSLSLSRASHAQIHRRVRGYVLEEEEKPFVYFSGHDGTVLAFFSALGARYEQSPMYASHVAVEVYERHVDCEHEETREHHHSVLSRYFVRFFYDDQPLQVPACGEDHVCELHQLER